MKVIARWIGRGICLAGIMFFFLYSWLNYEKARDLDQNITIQLTDKGLNIQEIQQMISKEKTAETEVIFDFTAWAEEKQVRVSDLTTGRMTSVNVMKIYGSSELLLPYGRILHEEDIQGCLIGKATAKKLFGTSDAIGFTVCYNGIELVVRGVIEEPEELLVMQASIFPQTQFDHIALRRDNTFQIKQKAERFLTKYNLNGKLLRWDYYGELSWIEELIPGKWSDFEGWKEKIALMKQDYALLSSVQKSTIEVTYCNHCSNGQKGILLGILLLLISYIFKDYLKG